MTLRQSESLTERKQKKRGGKEEQRIEKLLNLNSFVDIHMFVKTEVFNARK